MVIYLSCIILYSRVHVCVCVGAHTCLCMCVRGGAVGFRHLPQLLLFFETSPLTVFRSHQ